MTFLNPATLGLRNHIAHCRYLYTVLGEPVSPWTAEEWRPYLAYWRDGKPVDAMFGGLLLEADRSSSGEAISAHAIGFGGPPTSAGWQKAIDELFVSDGNLPAAVAVSREQPSLPPVDIWITLPYPDVTRQPFGSVGKKTLDFHLREEDRKTALTWWIGEVLSAWNQLDKSLSGHRCRLCGFAWTKNSFAPGDEKLVGQISRFLHDRKLKLLWCQNYGTTNAHRGRELGFDLICTRPTVNGTPLRGAGWIASAAKLCRIHNLGMIIWGDPFVSNRQLDDFLQVGRQMFSEAFQLYELGDKAVYQFWRTNDPIYHSLYSYMAHSGTVSRGQT